jgi:hypothetical protein
MKAPSYKEKEPAQGYGEEEKAQWGFLGYIRILTIPMG